METIQILCALFKIILAILSGITCGFFIYFIDYTFWKGAIFEFYLPFLAETLLKFIKPKEYKKIIGLKKTMPKEQYQDLLKEEASDKVFLYKMLGGCPVCFGMWIAMSSYTILCYNSVFEWYYFFPYVFTSSWLIRKLVGATY